MKWLRNKIRAWLGVSDMGHDVDWLKDRVASKLVRIHKRLDDRIAELDQLTKVDVDVGFRGPCTVILTGVYRGQGYVKFYEMEAHDFLHEVERYKDMRKHSLIRNVDAPFSFRHAMNFEL